MKKFYNLGAWLVALVTEFLLICNVFLCLFLFVQWVGVGFLVIFFHDDVELVANVFTPLNPF